MKKCKKCNINHTGLYGSGRFCSSKCARSFSTAAKRIEINKIVSKKLLGRKIIKQYSDEKWKEINEKRKEFWKRKLLNANFNDLGIDGKRNKVIVEQNYKCNRCGLDKWLEFKLILEIEHIDGNHYNNERNNLEALCPNCHSLTLTWRGRNKQNQKHKINDETLLNALLKNSFNMRQALISVGLAAKGGNYNRCHRLKREYEEISNIILS